MSLGWENDNLDILLNIIFYVLQKKSHVWKDCSFNCVMSCLFCPQSPAEGLPSVSVHATQALTVLY